MRMQAAKIYYDPPEESADSSNEFILSGVLSEWLFVSHFWRDFNEKNGTMFSQFEEDVVDVLIIKKIEEELLRKFNELMDIETPVIRFIYRWSPSGEVDIAVMERDLVLTELTELCKFLKGAVEKNRPLIFAL